MKAARNNLTVEKIVYNLKVTNNFRVMSILLLFTSAVYHTQIGMNCEVEAVFENNKVLENTAAMKRLHTVMLAFGISWVLHSPNKSKTQNIFAIQINDIQSLRTKIF